MKLKALERGWYPTHEPLPRGKLRQDENMVALKKFGAWVVLSAVLLGCSTIPKEYSDTSVAYQAAIADAAVASPSKIAPLLALPAGPTVSVVSWISDRKTPCAGQSPPCEMSIGKNPVWVTLAGEVQTQCRSWPLRSDALRRRLEQLLGLPMDPPLPYRMTKFMLLEVPREHLERPCLGVDETDPVHPTCTLSAQPDTSLELRTFVGQQMVDSYVVDGPNGPGYPYTRLGYTYDWSSTANPKRYGASEFIIAPGTTVKVIAVVPTDDYCSTP